MKSLMLSFYVAATVAFHAIELSTRPGLHLSSFCHNQSSLCKSRLGVPAASPGHNMNRLDCSPIDCRAGDITDWERCLKLNVLAPMAMTHAFSPGMVKRKVSVTTCLQSCVVLDAQIMAAGSPVEKLVWSYSCSTATCTMAPLTLHELPDSGSSPSKLTQLMQCILPA